VLGSGQSIRINSRMPQHSLSYSEWVNEDEKQAYLDATSLLSISLLDKKWLYEDEKRAFLEAVKFVADSTRRPEQLLRDGIGHLVGNKSDSICLIETTSYPEDALVGDKPSCFVSCSTSPVSVGDFLGILPGYLRYQNFQDTQTSIPGVCDVWLDTSRFIAPLNRMKIATSSEDSNIALCWEAVNEKGGNFCDYWRVRVHARRSILPMEPFVRENFCR
jgi:hypothetical protein